MKIILSSVAPMRTQMLSGGVELSAEESHKRVHRYQLSVDGKKVGYIIMSQTLAGRKAFGGETWYPEVRIDESNRRLGVYSAFLVKAALHYPRIISDPDGAITHAASQVWQKLGAKRAYVPGDDEDQRIPVWTLNKDQAKRIAETGNANPGQAIPSTAADPSAKKLPLARGETVVFTQSFPAGHPDWILTSNRRVFVNQISSWSQPYPLEEITPGFDGGEGRKILKKAKELWQYEPDIRAKEILRKWSSTPMASVSGADVLGDWIQEHGTLEMADPRIGKWLRSQDDLEVAKVLKYIDILDDLPAISVAKDGKNLIILDGHHRWLAAWYKRTTLPAMTAPLPEDEYE